MNKRTTLLSLLALTLFAVLLIPIEESSATSFCDDCYQGTSIFGGGAFAEEKSDARCCFTGEDCYYIPEDWWIATWSKQYCSIESLQGGGYKCGSGVPSCSTGGGGLGGGFGGGGGSSCTISMAGYCPVNCATCIRVPFLK